MVRLMLSLGMLTALALAITVARRELLLGSPEPPPSFTATMISLAILVKAAERLASPRPWSFGYYAIWNVRTWYITLLLRNTG